MSRVGEVAAASYPAGVKRELRLAWLKRPAVLRTLSVLVVLGLWEIVGRHTMSLSYPTAIVRAAYHTMRPDVLPAFGDTMSAFWMGYAICVVLGIPIGLLMARSRLAELSLWPYVSALYATPRLALIPVLILWLGITYEMRVSVVVISGLFPIILNTYLGGKEVDKSLVDVGVAFKAGRLRVLRTIVIPGSLHYIFAGLRIALGRALIGTIVAEIEASVLGIGNLISRDAQVLAMDQMFVPIILLGFFSLACSTFLKFGERWATMPWTRTRKIAWPSIR
jgi:NitT/TauT family transport system permease protein